MRWARNLGSLPPEPGTALGRRAFRAGSYARMLAFRSLTLAGNHLFGIDEPNPDLTPLSPVTALPDIGCMRETGSSNKAIPRSEYWREVIQQETASGQSVSTFCAKRGLTEQSLYSWKKLLSAQAPDPAPCRRSEEDDLQNQGSNPLDSRSLLSS